MLAPQGFAEGAEGLRIEQGDRPAPGGVFGPAAPVMHLFTRLGVPGVSRVEGTVGAAKNVHKMHRTHCTIRNNHSSCLELKAIGGNCLLLTGLGLETYPSGCFSGFP